MTKKLLVGISSCLLGEPVRFDGSHKRNEYICNFLGKYVDFLPICPEVAIGLGTPRPAIQLRGDPTKPRLVEVKAQQHEHSQAMLAFAQQTMPKLGTLCGYILKSKSPSCGWKQVKIYQDNGRGPLSGQGMYAGVLEQSYPYLPIEEEGRLKDSRLRENFIERIFVYNEWLELQNKLDANCLLAFHTRHKLSLMAHSPSAYRALGQMLSQLKDQDLQVLSANYLSTLMQGLCYLATPKKHANVLQHCLGYFKKQLAPIDKQELLQAIDSYRCGLVPLIVPITLIKHHLLHYPQPYLSGQSYLAPYPEELMLRNHI